MGRLILITCIVDELDRYMRSTGKKRLVVSNGIDEDTGRSVTVPCDPPYHFPGAYFDRDLHEWVIEEKER